MKKQPLIILGIFLIVVILILIVYAYQSIKISEPELQTSIQPGVEKEDSKKEIQKLKDGFANETLEINEISEEGCSEEEVTIKKEHEEDVKAGIAKIAEGKVLEKGNNYLKVKLSQGSLNWNSNVKVNQETIIKIANFEKESVANASISDIQINDKVTIKSNGENNILNSEFTASRIIVER